MIILLFCHEPIYTGVHGKEVTEFFTGEKKVLCAAFENCDEISAKAYKLITNSSDVIRGVFCGHRHFDAETEIEAGYEKDGKFIKQNISEYLLTSNVYGGNNQVCGHVMKITVK